jgi:excinuclease ABC subunit C
MARKVTKSAEVVRGLIANGTLYPHLKLTRETFPRLLVTRKVLDPADEYFGAFLPNTSVRIWLYHLNKIFRLRSCDLALDGGWPLPCSRYFSKECVAPCVAGLCDEAAYQDRVQAVRFFLSGAMKEFEQFVTERIDRFAEGLEFEKAAEWRDLSGSAKALAASKRFDIRIDRAVDTYSVIETADNLLVHLVTSRGRRMIGNREFVFEKNAGWTAESAVEAILGGFYQFNVPREIRLPFALVNGKQIQRTYLDRFDRAVKFSIHENELKDAARRRLNQIQVDFGLEKIGTNPTPEEIGAELKRFFGLRKKPRRIEAFDVAHISNQNFVTASCVWDRGEIRPDRLRYWAIAAETEPAALAFGVRERLTSPPVPDLILVDGGHGQQNAVLEVLRQSQAASIPVVAATKPAGQHKQIAHFFTPKGEQIEFIAGNRALELLRELRDEAHQNANELHRQQRDSKAIFEDVNVTLLLTPAERKALLKQFGSLKAIGEAPESESAKLIGTEKARQIRAAAGMPSELPLVITRLNEIGGAANDLRQIKAPIDR